jgi:DNA-directed RNA polymerase specialized sigma subunit
MKNLKKPELGEFLARKIKMLDPLPKRVMKLRLTIDKWPIRDVARYLHISKEAVKAAEAQAYETWKSYLDAKDYELQEQIIHQEARLLAKHKLEQQLSATNVGLRLKPLDQYNF